MSKNKKVFTFVYPDFEYNITKKGLKAETGGWYHEGIAQLAAIIEDKGWDVGLIHHVNPEDKVAFQKRIKELKPDVIGFSVRTGVREYARKLIKWAREVSDALIIVGSYHPTLWPDEVINWDGVNAICIGEGENSIKELIKRIDLNKTINNIPSLWVKDNNGEIQKNPVGPLECDLDSLPIPKFEIFDFKKLIPSQIKAAVVVLTRGCPYNCTYCWNNFARNLYPNREKYVRYRSARNAVDYIKQVEKVYPEVRSFRFQDDLWPFYNDWFDNLADLYEKEVNKDFECHLRANLLNEKIIKRLKEIRCIGIYFGVESGNEYIRNKILKRNMTEKTLLDAFLTCKKYGIRTHAYNIVGIPHENMKRVLDTVKLNAKLQPTDMFFPIFFPYAGTELYDIAVESGFFDPKQKLDPYVNIEMPDFKRNRIRFASLYSKTFVRLYQFVFKANKSIRKPFEKLLDALWLCPYWPYRLMNFFVVTKRKVELWTKIFIKKYFFNLYLLLKK